MLRGHTGARHDGGGRGQTQCTGACNDQHGHTVNERDLEAVTRQPPSQQRAQSQHQHDRYKHGRHLIDQALNGRLRSLCIFNKSNDVGEHGGGTGGADLNNHATLTIDAAASDTRAHCLEHRQGLAGQHGFIDLRLPFKHGAICSKALTRQHHHAVIEKQFFDGNFHFTIQRDDTRFFRTQGMQSANGIGGLTLSARFQPFA